MPLKVSVGLNKKLGLPNYGSVGAHCDVEFEVAASLLHTDLDAFHKHVRDSYQACARAVQEELARQRQAEGPVNGPSPGPRDGNASNGGTVNGNGMSLPRASEKQLEYARQLAGQIRGLGIRRLEALASKLFHTPLADLSSLDASALIDQLRSIKSGKSSVETILNQEES